MAAPLTTTQRKSGLLDAWGRLIDRPYSYDFPPTDNPDTTEDTTKWDYSNTPWFKGMRNYRSIARLFVSAHGLTKAENGVDYPPQLIYTTPSLGTPEIFDFVAMQFDEGFTHSGFGRIMDSLETTAMREGWCVGEIEWYRREKQPFKNKIMASFVWDRDPNRYKWDPENKKPGLYRINGYDDLLPCDPNKFISYAYDANNNNPYGNSINSPIQNLIDTWIKVFGYWRHALEKAGLGAWVAIYDPVALAGDEADPKLKRAALLSQVQKIASGTASIFPNYAELQNHKLQMEAQSFLDFTTFFVQTISMLYTGSPTALTEGEYGSYSKEESTTVRNKQALEILDSMRVCAFWSYVFIPILVDINFSPNKVKIYPFLQLIPAPSIAPTTPDTQDTVDEIEDTEEPQAQQEPTQPKEDTQGEPAQQEMMLAELQEEETEPATPPVAIPGGYKDFPNKEPLPESYRNVVEAAQDWLENEYQVKEYDDVSPREAPKTFTVKRFRNFDRDMLPILQDLKAAIVPTLAMENEEQAWEEYYDSALAIFAANSLSMDTAIRGDLLTSFRQARQNAFFNGLLKSASQDSAVTGIEFSNLHDGHDIRSNHKLFDGVKVPLDHAMLTEKPVPWDFGCLCFAKPYYGTDFTPDEQIPDLKLLGQSYRYYTT